MPFHKYSGRWDSCTKTDHPDWVAAWLAYLTQHCSGFLDIETIRVVANDHQYVSNIPIGAGLGSSGALTASIYDIGKRTSDVSLEKLKSYLGLMESFFHGKSSGLDPTISYLQHPILCTAEKQVREIKHLSGMKDLHCYLLDSGVERSGKSFIDAYLRQASEHPVHTQYIVDLNNTIINDITSDTTSLSYEKVTRLSALQYEYMLSMIIPDIREIWKAGLNKGQYAMKLCGAGGGGYYLVISPAALDRIGPYPLSKLQM